MYKSSFEFVEPGHYYSAIPNLNELELYSDIIWNQNKIPLGIDMNVDYQLEIFFKLLKYYKDIIWENEHQSGLRFKYNNSEFGCMDAIILCGLMRLINPKNIIEIGCGFSSAVMMDTNELFFNNSINMEFIEPFPERLYSILKTEDTSRYKIIQNRLQDVPLNTFDKLKDKDILFIDSTHVLKTGSDVERILGEIIPNLSPGVLIHFHDIHWPFVIYKNYAMSGIAWNEVYAIRSFLQFNGEFEILFMLHWMSIIEFDKLIKYMPIVSENSGSGLWIRRKGGEKI